MTEGRGGGEERSGREGPVRRIYHHGEEGYGWNEMGGQEGRAMTRKGRGTSGRRKMGVVK